jgi:Fe-S cluster assembly ATP-binding protein
MLEIKDLVVEIDGRKILNGVNLTVGSGEVHAIMGPNGAGKSTLSAVIAGKPGFDIISGSVAMNGADLLLLSPEERAAEGVFLGFQYPVEIPGVNNAYFLRMAVNNKRQREGLDELDAFDFMALVKEKMALLKMDDGYLKRALNAGFSGGEKKRNEILQMLLLEPKLAVLDETDSGLDIDALQIVAQGINCMRSSERSFLMVTHYQRLLEYVKPDVVHVLLDGKIRASGQMELVHRLEKEGYAIIENEAL